MQAYYRHFRFGFNQDNSTISTDYGHEGMEYAIDLRLCIEFRLFEAIYVKSNDGNGSKNGQRYCIGDLKGAMECRLFSLSL